MRRYREPVEGTSFGRYQLIELLGRGGMGEVWRAHDTMIDRVVALKMLLPHFAKDPDFDRRFRREARTAARLDDPHVVPIYDVGEIDGRLYVTMRLINGVDLETLLKSGPLKPDRAVYIIEQIASALHAAHQAGLVHRDVKPSNILLGDNDFAYLIDFGIARAADDTALTSEGSTIGTWAYMAPERFRAGDIQPSSDIYALACVLYQCLTGEPPFPGSTLEQVAVGHMVAPPPRPSEVSRTVPAGLDRVIETGLAKQSTDRFPTAVDMATAARQAITGPITPAPPPPMTPPAPPAPPWTPPPPPPPSRTRRTTTTVVVIAATAAVALLITGVVFAGIHLMHRASMPPAAPSQAQPPANAAPVGALFSGTYRADYGPGTDLAGKPVAGAPTSTATWNVRSTCGAGGCVATASIAGGGGVMLVSNMVFDQIGGSWVGVALASAKCTAEPTEIWVVYTLQPRPDGTLSGDTTRADTASTCDAKRTVTFTRTGDVDPNSLPDPAGLPPRAASQAQVLRGRYHETVTFTNGDIVPGQDDLTVETNCLRTGDRCMSLFHAPDGVVTLMFADDKWTRNEQGTVPCTKGGTSQITLTAEYPMPQRLQDPLQELQGHGRQDVAPASACPAGGDLDDKFTRTGD